jgi:hypothetical protein
MHAEPLAPTGTTPRSPTPFPRSFAEAMETRRALLGDAEYDRQAALLRLPPPPRPERRAADRRRTDRRAGA